MVGDWLAQTLQYELVPMCEKLNSVEAMEKLFQVNPDWSLNTHNGGNICTDLIVAKINRKRDFHRRYEELIYGIQQKIEKQLMSPESRELLTLCYESIS